MGPEVAESTLFMTNCHIQEMRGPDDADGLFLDVPTAGSRARISHCTIVEGDDDGIDTLDAVFTLQDTIVRGWRNPHEDSKGISLEGGEAQLSRVLLTDVAIGVSGKGNTGARVRLGMDRCTVFSSYYALGATNDSGTQPIIDYTVTNSILRGTRDSIFTQYEPSGIRVYFSNLGETWPGSANTVADPGLSPETLEPLPGSPCIDGGYSLSTPDPDGSLADIGFWPYRPPAPLLRARSVSGTNMHIILTAFPGRNYILESTFSLRQWAPVSTNWQAATESNLIVPALANAPVLFLRARLAGE
jgi:hypothetical protein